jgi:hypothetical protein
MQFSTSIMALVASAVLSKAASVTFWTLDDVERTIYFTPNPESAWLDSVTVGSGEQKKVTFPDAWVGNYYAVPKGQDNVPGMLGEVQFSGWNGLTYFDVSAIIHPGDHNNVKQMWPANSKSPMSGCEVFPCNNAYYLPDDVQTKVTSEVDLVQTLGSGSTGMSF